MGQGAKSKHIEPARTMEKPQIADYFHAIVG
jgi:hypothetical protein